MSSDLLDWLDSTHAEGHPPGRPRVTLSYAQSLDGSLSASRGQPLALSGPESLRLTHELRAYNLQDQGLDTIDANLALGHAIDDRDYSIAVAILKELGVGSVRLLTNNPKKMEELQQKGIQVDERIGMLPTVYPDNYYYLLTKAQRMNHLINLNVLPRG